MAKTLQELRDEIAVRCGFGGQGGVQDAQISVVNSWLVRSQEEILSEFGSMLPGTIYPPNPFGESNDDTPSVPENALLLRALIKAKTYYRQPVEATINEWRNYEASARGLVAP